MTRLRGARSQKKAPVIRVRPTRSPSNKKFLVNCFKALRKALSTELPKVRLGLYTVELARLGHTAQCGHRASYFDKRREDSCIPDLPKECLKRLPHRVVSARQSALGVHDLIELNHSSGKERLTSIQVVEPHASELFAVLRA